MADAIRMANRRTETIDLLLTDVIMPELSGPGTRKAAEVARSRAEGALHVWIPG